MKNSMSPTGLLLEIVLLKLLLMQLDYGCSKKFFDDFVGATALGARATGYFLVFFICVAHGFFSFCFLL